jgi:hypothetical protein
MDTNYIKKDGFSNPDTERFFKKHWNEDLMAATCRARKHCGVCFCGFIFVDSVEDNLWLLCTHDESPYYLETLHFAFSCPYQDPCEEVQSIPCPSDPPSPPSERFGGPDLGLDHERE